MFTIFAYDHHQPSKSTGMIPSVALPHRHAAAGSLDQHVSSVMCTVFWHIHKSLVQQAPCNLGTTWTTLAAKISTVQGLVMRLDPGPKPYCVPSLGMGVRMPGQTRAVLPQSSATARAVAYCHSNTYLEGRGT